MNYGDGLRIWCAPCDQFITFDTRTYDSAVHARRHGVALTFTERDGYFIGEPKRGSLASTRDSTPPITVNETLDVEATTDEQWTKKFAEAIK
jgi:hypothetical protein